jgi:putative glycosyltransferase (TIGR04348 family)
MKIFVACPAPAGSRWGNRVTATRWARFLQGLGHEVVTRRRYRGEKCDVMLALHARKSFPAISHYRQRFPKGPLVVALTGTDLYHDFPRSERAQQSAAWADRLVVLQPQALEELPASLRGKARVILQSAVPIHAAAAPRDRFEICVLGHLRPVKDPFRAALALRLLPRRMRVRLTHAGQASTAAARRARSLMDREPRYRWIGEVSHPRARRLIARSHLLVISSRMEGAANVASEAIVSGVPLVSSGIGGIIGLLGADYPGFFPVGDTRALAGLLERVVSDAGLYHKLKAWCAKRRPLFAPGREQAAWKALLEELAATIRAQ